MYVARPMIWSLKRVAARDITCRLPLCFRFFQQPCCDNLRLITIFVLSGSLKANLKATPIMVNSNDVQGLLEFPRSTPDLQSPAHSQTFTCMGLAIVLSKS
ncbi:hypothetical protein PILCRDRAFT_562832 [Piloderma croceum F 1598]|uniref:Uncharacterized protein n=1 Tax=Piloderma croceum (strain F 1598) TaxID=765440 RepID=A0A0C3F3G1_PILCF|nr:hypothetical protein PILCRDRAFT_562832 [Piloderma croceum F 1598]